MPNRKVVFSGKEFEAMQHDLGKAFTTLKDNPKSNTSMVISELEIIVRQLARKGANDAKYQQVIFD